MSRIMVAEDDVSLSSGIVLALQNEGDVFVKCRTLAECREILFAEEAPSEMKNQEVKEKLLDTEHSTDAENFDLIILDLNFPDGNGLELLQEIRQRWQIPVIILTANDLEMDIVTGLELGADDYITKPFSLAVLRARVKNQLRKKRMIEMKNSAGQDTADGTKQEVPLYKAGNMSVDGTNKHSAKDLSIVETGDFMFDFNRMEYRKKDNSIELSKTEQKLLRLLVENRGHTMSRDVLIDRIWTDGAEYVDENALSVTVKRLRSKLEDNASQPEYIKTVYGIGYVWVK